MRKLIFLTLLLAFPAVVHGAADLALAPDGTVYKLEESEGRSIRRPFSSPAVFFSHGYEFREALPMDVQSFPLAPKMTYAEGTLIQGSGAGVYLISGGYKRPFASGKIFQDLGYSFANVLQDSDVRV